MFTPGIRILCAGCVFIAGCVAWGDRSTFRDKTDSDNVELSGVRAEQLTGLEAQLVAVEAQYATLKTQLTGVQAQLASVSTGDISSQVERLNAELVGLKASIGNLTGVSNTGAFSGGGLYVTIFGIALLAGGVTIGGLILRYRANRWRTAFEGVSGALHDVEVELGDNKATSAIKQRFKSKAIAAGIKTLVDENLAKRNLI